MLMPMCRSNINKSKSDLGVRLGNSLRIMLMSVCIRSYVNMNKSNLSVRLDISIKNHVDVCLQ